MTVYESVKWARRGGEDSERIEEIVVRGRRYRACAVGGDMMGPDKKIIRGVAFGKMRGLVVREADGRPFADVIDPAEETARLILEFSGSPV